MEQGHLIQRGDSRTHIHRKVPFIFVLGCRTVLHPRDIHRMGLLYGLQPPLSEHSNEYGFSAATGDIQLEDNSPPATNVSLLSQIFRGIHITCLGKWAICLLISKPLGSFSCHQELKDLRSHYCCCSITADLLQMHIFSAPYILFQAFKANAHKLTQVYYGAFKSDVNHKFAEDKLLYIFNKLLVHVL